MTAASNCQIVKNKKNNKTLSAISRSVHRLLTSPFLCTHTNYSIQLMFLEYLLDDYLVYCVRSDTSFCCLTFLFGTGHILAKRFSTSFNKYQNVFTYVHGSSAPFEVFFVKYIQHVFVCERWPQFETSRVGFASRGICGGWKGETQEEQPNTIRGAKPNLIKKGGLEC